MMLRFEVSVIGRAALPAIDERSESGGRGPAGSAGGEGAHPRRIDTADSVVVIGSGPAARVRLPPEAARDAHVRIVGQSWTLLAECKIGGMVRAAGDSGSVRHGMVVELGNYRVRVSAAPAGAPATPPQRTESLARELVRSLLGDGAAPSLEIERGPDAGTRRALELPESTLVIGRGDEASWVILDEDLSRTHAEIRRGWDGVAVADLGSKNGTRVDGQKVGARPVALRDGALLSLGNVALRFRDPAERHLRGEPAPEPTAGPSTAPARSKPRVGKPGAAHAPTMWPFIAFTTITVLALVALLWVLAT
jgi:hypothetical protein